MGPWNNQYYIKKSNIIMHKNINRICMEIWCTKTLCSKRYLENSKLTRIPLKKNLKGTWKIKRKEQYAATSNINVFIIAILSKQGHYK